MRASSCVLSVMCIVAAAAWGDRSIPTQSRGPGAVRGPLAGPPPSADAVADQPSQQGPPSDTVGYPDTTDAAGYLAAYSASQIGALAFRDSSDTGHVTYTFSGVHEMDASYKMGLSGNGLNLVGPSEPITVSPLDPTPSSGSATFAGLTQTAPRTCGVHGSLNPYS